jgi:2-keto-4-pentenoate hydratase
MPVGEHVAELTERLAAARAAGDVSPAWVNDLDLDTAQAVAAGLLRRELADGAVLAGWKVGFTSPRVRALVGTEVRPFGRILGDHVLPSGTVVDTAAIRHPSIEAELCFTFARPLDGDEPSRADVLAALGTVSAAFELNERRAGSARPTVAAMITDVVTHWGIVVGDGRPVGEVDLPAVRCTMRCDGEERYTGVSADELDDHLGSLAALAAGLHRHGLAIDAGHRVITGAFCRFDVAAGQHWEAAYDGVGTVDMRWR